MKCRTFIHTSILAAIAGSVSAAEKRAPRILLCNGWQIENIGDVAHTPGLLALLEIYLPDAEITFWPYYHHLPPEEVAMLKRRFPKLRIVEGGLDGNGKPPAEVAAIMDLTDFFLHGSGPSTVGWRQIIAFQKR